MPYTQLVNDFNTKYRVNVDSQSIVNHVTTVLTKYKDNVERDLLIKSYIFQRYPDMAAAHENRVQQERVINLNVEHQSDAKEFFEGYLGIISAITESTSKSLEKAAADAAVEAKKATEDTAKAAEEAARVAEEAEKNKAWDAKDKKDAAVAAAEKAKRTAERESDAFKFDRYESNMNYFGITEKEAEKMILGQVNSYTYSEARRFQMKKLGVTHPKFIEEVTSIGDVDYSTATDAQKKALQETYVTKNLMQARLDRHWAIWKFFHPWQTKAMETYVETANKVLGKAKFNGEAEAETLAAGGVDLNTDTVRSGLSEVKAVVSENEKIIQQHENDKKTKLDLANAEKEQKLKEEEEKRQKAIEEKQKAEEDKKLYQEQRLKDRKEKEEEIRKTIDENREQAQQEANVVEESTKHINDKFFEIRFRPSLDKAKLDEQTVLMLNVAKTYIEGKKHVLPVGVKSVFNANFEKLKAARAFVKERDALKPEELENKKDEFEAKKNELLDNFYVSEELVKHELKNLDVENYKPVTINEIENIALKNKIQKDTSDNPSTDKKSEPVDTDKTLKIDPISKTQS